MLIINCVEQCNEKHSFYAPKYVFKCPLFLANEQKNCHIHAHLEMIIFIEDDFYLSDLYLRSNHIIAFFLISIHLKNLLNN